MIITLTDEQMFARDGLVSWVRHDPSHSNFNNVKIVAGSAGTGKTVLIVEFIKELQKKSPVKIACVAYTGKASSILSKKIKEYGIESKVDFIGTIHSLVYEPIYEVNINTRKKEIIGWKRKYFLDNIDIIIIDEASMVSKFMWQDLLTFRKLIIAFGDNKQLPPIDETAEFPSNIYNDIFNKPSYTLTIPQRTALESPIIKLAYQVIEKGYIDYKIYSKNVFKLNWSDKECVNLFHKINHDKDTIVLCGFNSTRVELNKIIRNKFGFTEKYPYPGDRIICLKNNSIQKLMNGQLGTLVWVLSKNEKLYNISAELDDRDTLFSTLAHKELFGRTKYDEIWKYNTNKETMKLSDIKHVDYFDYGYAISVHKSQGSEWNKVVLFEQRARAWTDEYYKRWLYTAITRARERLFIIGNYFDY